VLARPAPKKDFLIFCSAGRGIGNRRGALRIMRRPCREWGGSRRRRSENESVSEGGGTTGHGVAFCVRLCDGHHFPMENMAKTTPTETCRAICPYSKTKVFFGAEIAGAVAQDGQRYADLDTAFVYRKQLVDKCTCNGRDAMGLAPLDVRNDPTLRPGDMVATKEGIATYTGRPGANFTPVNPASLPVDIR
jgi:hypothetical protein